MESLETDGMRSVSMLDRMEAEMHGVEAVLVGLEASEKTANSVMQEHADVLERGLVSFEDVLRGLRRWGEEVCLSACRVILLVYLGCSLKVCRRDVWRSPYVC